ncbi:gluconolactonase [Folsomia candida]|uniref:Regucalcin n=1 Tax=Folsomia candida TaxID=158441 RepID=A0A226EVL0_FOLCA|nr:gluconolactonase [Folsomia candida]OXA61124.1 Regucalcin [Folsomia candida]
MRTFMILALFWPALVSSCDLVPVGPPSCLDLTSTSHISTDTQFGQYIEGSGTNRKGEMFAVNYGNDSTLFALGQFHPQQRLFYADPVPNTHFNGIRFLNDNTAYTVDVANHRVLQLTVNEYPDGPTVVGSSVFCADPTMLQPNDLTLSKLGTVFTSGMRWLQDTNDTHGDIWSCLQNGEVKRLEVMGRTNGIDLSPDDTKLYVSESYTRGGTPYVQKIWLYDANVTTGTISGKRLFVDFEVLDGTQNVDIDGMKTDVAGNLWVTRHGGREVVAFDSTGAVIARVRLTFPNPTNLEFGGPSGRTIYVVGKCDGANTGCTDTLEVVTPGRSWSNLQPSGSSTLSKGVAYDRLSRDILWGMVFGKTLLNNVNN